MGAGRIYSPDGCRGRKIGKKAITYYTIATGNVYVGLGHDLAAARQKLTNDPGKPAAPGSIGELVDEHLKRAKTRLHQKKLSQVTYDDYEEYVRQLKKPLGKMRIEDLTKKHVWDYLHTYRGATSPSRANQEISFLWGAYEVLVETEVLTRNPCTGVERNETSPRERKVSRDELYDFFAFCRANGHIVKETEEALKAKKRNDSGARLAFALELSYLTTHAQGEVIKLTRTRLKAEGIEWPLRKGGAPTLTEWTPALKACVEGAWRCRR